MQLTTLQTVNGKVVPVNTMKAGWGE